MPKQKPIQIIRIQFSDGYGIFRSDILDKPVEAPLNDNPEYRKLQNRHCKMGEDYKHFFPTPEDDGLDIFTGTRQGTGPKEWLCAFKTVDQVKEWITTEEIKVLVDYEATVLLLTVTEYQEGKAQVIYTVESIASSEDITSLFVESPAALKSSS